MPGFTPARTALIAAAAALAAAGLVVSGPAPEGAAACKYEFPGSFVSNQGNGYRVEMNASGQNLSGRQNPSTTAKTWPTPGP